jgi:hypothetical protein
MAQENERGRLVRLRRAFVPWANDFQDLAASRNQREREVGLVEQ